MNGVKGSRLVGVVLVALLVALLAVPVAFADELVVAEPGAIDEGSAGAAVADEADAQDRAAKEAARKAKAKAAAEAARKAKLARRTVKDGLYNLASVAKPGYSVSVQNGSKKAGALAIPESGDTSSWSQKWAVSWDSKSGYYLIRNLDSRKFLGVPGKAAAGSAVKQFRSAHSRAQRWELEKVEKGVVLRPAGSKLALAVTGGKARDVALKLVKAKTANAQAFKLKAVDALDADKTYYISAVDSGKRLEVAGSSRAPQAKIGVAKAQAAKSQKFRLVKAGSSYRLQNVGSLYYVGAAGKDAKGVCQLAGKSGKSAASAWRVKVDLKAAAFTIMSKSSGKRLDAGSGKLTLKGASDSAAQRFIFTPTYAFKLYLNPGHGFNSNGNGVVDPGAVGFGHTEAEFSHDLARRVEGLLADTDVRVVNGEQFGLAFWNRMPKAVSLGCDAIVSIHFDAGGDSGTLGMVGVQGKAPGSDTLSRIIREHVVASLGLPDRGPVTRSDITCVNGSIPSMLVEVCFMDNYHDVTTYLAKRDAVARGLADGILKATRNRDVVR